MKTVTASVFRQEFARTMAWVEQGEEVEITRRGRVIARLVPVSTVPAVPPTPEPAAPAPRIPKMPGFESSMKKLFGE